MKILNEKPPNWDEYVKHFDVEGKPYLFPYGDTIYNPTGVEVADHAIAHEECHERQQIDMGGVENWCDQYFKDDEFRLKVEIEAYAVQYNFVRFRGDVNSKNLKDFLGKLAGALSGGMYGDLLTQGEAESKIRNKAKELA